MLVHEPLIKLVGVDELAELVLTVYFRECRHQTASTLLDLALLGLGVSGSLQSGLCYLIRFQD
jgi:hypothetical protein